MTRVKEKGKKEVTHNRQEGGEEDEEKEEEEEEGVEEEEKEGRKHEGQATVSFVSSEAVYSGDVQLVSRV